MDAALKSACNIPSYLFTSHWYTSLLLTLFYFLLTNFSLWSNFSANLFVTRWADQFFCETKLCDHIMVFIPDFGGYVMPCLFTLILIWWIFFIVAKFFEMLEFMIPFFILFFWVHHFASVDLTVSSFCAYNSNNNNNGRSTPLLISSILNNLSRLICHHSFETPWNDDKNIVQNFTDYAFLLKLKDIDIWKWIRVEQTYAIVLRGAFTTDLLQSFRLSTPMVLMIFAKHKSDKTQTMESLNILGE